ncbi:hypothetical protein IFM89_011007 [Coptis chinensis]|uniref:Cupin type-1 domain-containing protein n=1 Tax=Coptis chinensis TaxID=261450 RepID=A0A835M8G7_9MAGN|nr:hypothetical protein IFM89_011007 [Coptis chinensis]
MMKQNISALPFFVLLLVISVCVIVFGNVEDVGNVGSLVRKDKRETIAETEDGRISAVDIHDGTKGRYHLQFLTLEPNSLFLPVLLHADMVFFVQTGSGRLSWADEEANKNHIDVKRGDIYRLQSGSVFFVKSSLESAREKLRVCAIFTDELNTENPHVPEDVIDSMIRKSKPPPIVHSPSTNKTGHSEWTDRIFEVLTGGGTQTFNSKKPKTKTFNIMESKPDFENCNGWSKTVSRKDLLALKGSNIGVFMVNLTRGSMMGPHWNPRASEIAIVMHGQGMVHVVCSSLANASECKNRRFRVKEGDVFAVPRFHPMAQMAYNNDTFVFMGFSTMASRNHPQFLAGKSSVLQTLDKDTLAMSFNVPNTTIDQLLSSQADSIILSCVSCAEEEEQRMKEEIERQRQEEARREEEEARKREEEEARRREKEDARKREEEEAREREEEEARKREEEEERERKKEEAKKQEEEKEREREEEETRKQEEEKEREREEEEAREREAAEERKREEEARREQEATQRREEERRSEEEEEARRQEGEESRREEEAARRQEEEREERRRQEEESRRQEEEEEEERRGREEEWRGEGGRGSRKIFIF